MVKRETPGGSQEGQVLKLNTPSLSPPSLPPYVSLTLRSVAFDANGFPEPEHQSCGDRNDPGVAGILIGSRSQTH